MMIIFTTKYTEDRYHLSYLLMRSVFYSSLTESAEWAGHKYDNSSPQVSANKDPVDTSRVYLPSLRVWQHT